MRPARPSRRARLPRRDPLAVVPRGPPCRQVPAPILHGHRRELAAALGPFAVGVRLALRIGRAEEVVEQVLNSHSGYAFLRWAFRWVNGRVVSCGSRGRTWPPIRAAKYTCLNSSPALGAMTTRDA